MLHICVISGLWFSLNRCRRVRVFEYVPSTRASRRCHYYAHRDDVACTFGAWHPLAQEKALAETLRDNSDIDTFQRGFIDITGLATIQCWAVFNWALIMQKNGFIPTNASGCRVNIGQFRKSVLLTKKLHIMHNTILNNELKQWLKNN